MKILQVCSTPISFFGGMEKMVLRLSESLSKDHEVTVLQTNLYEEDKPHKKEKKIGNIKVITCKNDYFLKGYGYSREFKKVLKKIWKEYDIIHIYGFGRFTSSFALKFLKNKKPLIFTACGFFHTKNNSLFKKIHNIYFKKLIKNANYCTALTELEIVSYADLGVKKENIKVIPCGVNIRTYSKKINEKPLLRKYFTGLDKELATLIYVGRLHKSKGISSVLRAIKTLNVNFLIVGRDAGYKKRLVTLTKELKLEQRVRFLENVTDDELIGLYRLSEVFILYSEWEGFGIVLIEAMASGIPVIARNKGSMPFLVKDDFNGYIVKNEKELNEKIRYFLKNKKKLKIMGLNSKKFASNYDWGSIALKYLEIYNDKK